MKKIYSYDIRGAVPAGMQKNGLPITISQLLNGIL